MPPRSTWKGFLNLSLVSVAVKAYTATSESSKIRLNQLHADCNSRIKYEKTCPVHGTVSNDEIIKGYEYAKDQYAIIDLDELDRLRTTEEVRSIRIECFVKPEMVDPIYLSASTYYLAPDGVAGQKPFALVLGAMRDRGVCCVARAVLSKREHVVLIRPEEKLMSMTILRYAAEVRKPDAFEQEVSDTQVSDQEMALAKTLIDETTVEELDFEQYKDEYVEKLSQLIESKVHGEELVAPPEAEPTSVINLMDALRASVSAAQSEGAEPPQRMKAAARTTKKESAKSEPKDELKNQLARKTKKTPRKKKTG